MPFGQIGFTDTGGGGSVGGGWDIFSDVITAAGSIFGAGGALGQQLPTQTQFLPPMIPPVVGSTLGGMAGGALAELLPSLLGGNGNGATGGQLFKPPTASMKPRPVNKIQVMGPDGKCHTWFHATPTGYRVNASNVRGRRKHRHPR